MTHLVRGDVLSYGDFSEEVEIDLDNVKWLYKNDGVEASQIQISRCVDNPKWFKNPIIAGVKAKTLAGKDVYVRVFGARGGVGSATKPSKLSGRSFLGVDVQALKAKSPEEAKMRLVVTGVL